ncbi:hypothetical protein SAMN04487936_101277 [Halobacillus dabanensis]|uniref:Uncharacterized protein n=1 Tax=Halobacillus dabanensis TaxID=240302 RepID=A0A1I3PDG4_HALDA|nr:hypothetical protein [Halobacillus dabanensis]SFJ19598.1 hypothetical protein SAMN04487936_101277 [Halobacillus dabanensis]
MGDLIDLIFSNFLIIAAIIGGIVSWFSGMTKENETKQKRSDRSQSPKPSPYPSGPSQELEQKERTGEERLKEYYENKQQKLKEMTDSNSERERGVWEPMEPNTHSALQGQKNKSSKASQLAENGPLIESARKWDKKRLAEGILMAEVLGPPRARKPHSSHPRKR